MLKTRLYYKDEYCQKFTATVVEVKELENGTYAVILENTAFYPTGGGQPHDTGTLNGVKVLQVEEMDGIIHHIVEQPLTIGEEVVGEIDWSRRFDHMQQHSGQHILTAAFEELFEMPTVSFHLGEEICTIDLDAKEVTDEQLEKVETRANEIIRQNLPIEKKWVTEDELAQYPLRKEVTVSDEIRLVIIPGIDYNGCGGTHPRSTGEVMALKILGTEKMKKKVRVHFIAGDRILTQFQRKHEILKVASQLLSAPEERIVDTLKNVLEKNVQLEKTLEMTRETIRQYEAKAILETKKNGLVHAVYTGETIKGLQQLAKIIVSEDEEAIAILVTENEENLQFVIALGSKVQMNLRDISQMVLSLIEGKGGGSPTLIQGGGKRTMDPTDFIHEVEKIIFEKIQVIKES